VLVILIEMALITPPVGLNLFAVQSLRERGTLNDVMIGTAPFVGAMLLMIVLPGLFTGTAALAARPVRLKTVNDRRPFTRLHFPDSSHYGVPRASRVELVQFSPECLPDMLSFERIWQDRRDRIAVEIDTLIVAGWTGRDAEAIEHHIAELGAIGVPAPSTVPLFYRLAATQLSQVEYLQVLGPDTSGEVEPVLVSLADGLWVTLGSDHTDRKAETMGVALSKQLCSKVLARQLWRFDEVAPHWDKLILRAWATIDGERLLYQEGTPASIRSPQDLLERYSRGTALPAGSMMFCGTLGAIGGVRPGTRFEMTLEDPVLGRTLSHAYDVEALPVVS
jgi:hypothetical protein